jgi:hypothetical protein
MSGCADKVRPPDGGMAGLLPKGEDVEEVVGDAEDGAVGEVKLVLPWQGSADPGGMGH